MEKYGENSANWLFAFSDAITTLMSSSFISKVTLFLGMAWFLGGCLLVWDKNLVPAAFQPELAISLLCMGGGLLALWFLAVLNRPTEHIDY